MSETLRILVVDDDSIMAKTLADILKIKGYEVETAHSGAEALEKVAGAFTTVGRNPPSGVGQDFGEVSREYKG